MSTLAQEIVSINIEDELKQSFLDYAMSVIVCRALPDVRDGLKPVHRRVLYAMHELSNDWNKPYKKSARIVGDVIGKYHPHGDAAVYDTIVRMAQPFSLRYMLVDGQGNFGSVDGDSPAAMRYTEIRLSKIAHTLLSDLDKETVDFVPNYDETEFAPTVLPTRTPNLLINGSSGIAVGMATNIPPHNLNEIIDGCLALLANENTTIEELMQHIKGPDFPTAGIISGRAGIVEAYRTGRGKIYVRSRTSVETDEKTGKQAIIIHELPYQVNKARLQEKISELVKEQQLDGITTIRDESDKEGMRVVIELRRGESPDVLLNNLFTHTQMQVVFGINMVALDNNQPKTLNLKQILAAFLQHRREIVTRRTIFELGKAREQAHLLEGLAVALNNIDEIVALIKSAKTPGEAKEKLLAKIWPAENIAKLSGISTKTYQLSEIQAQAILDMRLHRLTSLEQDKIVNEYQALLIAIKQFLEILSNPERLQQVIRQELLEIKEQFGDARRTEIITDHQSFADEDLIIPEDVAVTLSYEGYTKIQPLSAYNTQHRGGKGKMAATTKEEDFITHLVIANTHDTLLCFSNLGKVYWLKTYLLPQGSRGAKGKPIINLLPLTKDERITAILPIKEYSPNLYIFMATAFGTVKKVALNAFSNQRSNGIIAIDLAEGDSLIGANITDGQQNIMLFSDTGKAICYNESQVRAMGRTARGVRGIRLKSKQKVVSLVIVKPDGTILTATENGYGKRTAVTDYPQVNRGGQGVIAIQTSERNGKLVNAIQVNDEDEDIMLITDQGTLVRTRVAEISIIGRNTQGVRLITLDKAEKLIGVKSIID
jgi:DNA gyrase subunit A